MAAEAGTSTDKEEAVVEAVGEELAPRKYLLELEKQWMESSEYYGNAQDISDPKEKAAYDLHQVMWRRINSQRAKLMEENPKFKAQVEGFQAIAKSKSFSELAGMKTDLDVYTPSHVNEPKTHIKGL